MADFKDGDAYSDECTLLIYGTEVRINEKARCMLCDEINAHAEKYALHPRRKEFRYFKRWYKHWVGLSAVGENFLFYFDCFSHDLGSGKDKFYSRHNKKWITVDLLDALQEDISQFVWESAVLSQLHMISWDSMESWIDSSSTDDYQDIIATYIEAHNELDYTCNSSDIVALFEDKLSVEEVEGLLLFAFINGSVVQDHLKKSP